MHDNDLQSLWFSVTNDVFEDFPRFSQLVNEHPLKNEVEVCFPRLVSFIGRTGAGKSTIIRTLLEKPWLTGAKDMTQAEKVPVVGKRNSTVPTSGDVHLYADYLPEKEFLDRPIFYADCEGFDGGAVVPSGSFAHKRSQMNRRRYSNHGQNFQSKVDDWIQYLVRHARRKTFSLLSYDPNTGNVPTREHYIEKLFPRLLYNFSDVVVFVVKEPRTLGNSIVDILSWASRSATSALNRATLPRLIIVINNAEQTEDWNPDTARANFFKEHRADIQADPNIRRHRDAFVSRGIVVESLEDLLLMHYASVNIIYIPNGHIRSQLSDQVLCLYSMIQTKTRESQQRKHDAGMLLQSQDQVRFFRLAFEHYIENIQSNKPFNFLAKLLQMHPIPHDLSNNFASLLYAIHRSINEQDNIVSASQLLSLAAPVVSSAIALSVIRYSGRVPGTLLDVFNGGVHDHDISDAGETYAKLVQNAIKILCNKIRCEFRTPGNTPSQCILFRPGHGETQKHQDEFGETIGIGKFKSDFVDDIRHQWRAAFNQAMDSTEKSIEKLVRPVTWQRSQSSHVTPSLRSKNDATWEVHYNHLRILYDKLPELAKRTAERLFLCYFCLREVPLQTLPCGHAPCGRCVKALIHCQSTSSDNDKRIISMKGCPLHQNLEVFQPVPKLQLKPFYSGVRILTIDGGGVRGLVELKLLQAVQTELGGRIPIQRFFDIIGGTSTGGLLALFIGIKDWSLTRCEEVLLGLCESAFTRHGSAWSGNLYSYLVHGCLYQNDPFERKLKEQLGMSRIMESQVCQPKYQGSPRTTQVDLFVNRSKHL